MIPHLQQKAEPSWQIQLQQAIRCPRTLLQRLQLDPALLPGAKAAGELFKLKVPESLLAKMEVGNPHDPILRQVLPLEAELHNPAGFVSDPLGEADASPVPGLLHKYKSRVLLTLTKTCALNCRYCFRREFPYQQHVLGQTPLQQALQYIAADASIKEVILSGGDPLVAPDHLIQKVIAQLATIDHLDTLRVHSRLPLAIAARLTDALLQILTSTRLQPVLVFHCNHPNEIDATFSARTHHWANHGVTLLNQSVLLAGVNDDPATLAKLSKSLFAARVLPYYLHQLDPVRGSAHFKVPKPRATDIVKTLHQTLPGYLVPRWVTEVPGAACKTPLSALD